MAESRIFAPYKSLGLICDSVPLVLRRMPKQKLTVVLCAVGNGVHQYNAQTLRLISVSDSLPDKVKCLAADALYVYAGCGSEVFALHLSRQVKYKYKIPGESEVKFLLPFGGHLISVNKDNIVHVWDIEDETVFAEMPFDSETFTISALVHPATYMNKIVFGSINGRMKLVNLKTCKAVHDFDGWSSPVTVLEQSTAVDVLGIGLEDGRIVLHNIKFDETLLTFQQDWGTVTGLTFRSDGPPVLISCSSKGHLAVWDLEKQQVIGEMTEAHKLGVSGIKSIHGEPIFVTSGPDNALRTWIFDMSDGLARQLASREGHAKAPTVVKFHGEDGEMVLSAGNDSTIRLFSTWKDTKQQNLGTGGFMSRKQAKKYNIDPETIKLPPVAQLSSEMGKERNWDNLACCHKNSPLVTTWTTKNHKLGSHRLLHERFQKMSQYRNSTAMSCNVTSCGNFVLIGYSSGHLDLWNIQSGIYRGSFVHSNNNDKNEDKAHSSGITGIVSDSLNQSVVSGCEKGVLKFWRLKSKQLGRFVQLDAGIKLLSLHKDNSMLAIALENKAIMIVDVECEKPMRHFKNAHLEEISGLAFSPSGHWLLSAGKEGRIKVWDLPTATLIDVLEFNDVCTGIAMSPTGEYLATCHKKRKGVYLWANKTVFSSEILLKPLSDDYQPPVLDLPGSGPDPEELEDVEPEEMELIFGKRTEPEQLCMSLITLSGLPEPRWANLLQLDLIRKRNKPKEPPKKPKAAPFFLPTVSSLQSFSFDTQQADAEELEEEKKKKEKEKMKLSQLQLLTDFGRNLSEAESSADLMDSFADLLSYSPGKVDLEIRSLGPLNGGSEELLLKFLRMARTVLEKKRNFEVVSSHLGLFLKLHRDFLWSHEIGIEIQREMNEILRLQKDWNVLDEKIIGTLSMVQWMKSAVI